MNASAKPAAKRRLLLASDRSDESSELASILKAVGDVSTVTTQEIPDKPARDLSGLVVDINLRSPDSVQRVRNKLRGDAYRQMPRLFVLADALHHGVLVDRRRRTRHLLQPRHFAAEALFQLRQFGVRHRRRRVRRRCHGRR